MLAGPPNGGTTTTTGRIALAVAPSASTAGSHVLYVAVENITTGGLLYFGVSTSAGATTPAFIDRTSVTPDFLGSGNGSGQGWYDIAIGVDPSNPAIVYAAGVVTYSNNTLAVIKSTTSGASWTDITSVAVTNITSSTANGSYGAGASISIQVSFSAAVTVTGGPQLALNSGGIANYSSGSGTSTLTFTYVVGAGQNSAHLDYSSTSALTLNGGAIKDVSSNDASVTLPSPGVSGSLGFNKAIVIASAPTVTNVTSSTANGNYGSAAPISIQVSFSVAVIVTGTPQLALNSGGTASYSSGSGTATLTFTNAVAAGDHSADLDYASTSALTLNGGTIKDLSSNNANLTLPAPGATGSLGFNKNIVVNFGMSMSPSPGSAGRQVFTFVSRDSGGAASIKDAQFLFTNKAGLDPTNECYIVYTAGAFYVLGDDQNGWYGVAAGSAAAAGNAQCEVHGATSGTTMSGNDLTVTVDISFHTGFAGAKSAYEFSEDAGLSSGWILLGSWNDTGDANVVEVTSVSPLPGSGFTQTLTAVTKDGLGASTIPFVELLITAQPWYAFTGNGCFIFYAQASNVFYLLNDAATSFSGLVAGSATSVSNSQCTLHGVGSGGVVAGSTLTITYSLDFAAGFAGTKQVYVQTTDNAGNQEPWHLVGTDNP